MIRSLALLAITFFVFQAAAPAQAPDLSQLDIVERSVPDGPVAVVDGQPISREAFLFLYRQQIAAIKVLEPNKPIPDSIRAMTGIRCLAELVQRELLVTEAKKLNVSVSRDEVEQAFQKEVAQLQATLQEREGKSLSEAEILQRGNQTREEALDEIRKELIAARTRAQITKQKNITISDAEIQKFYNENPGTFRRPGGIHLKQIYVEPDPSAQQADEASWKRAEDNIKRALARIQAGETFEGVAKSAKNQGDLGMMPASALPPFYVEAASRLQPGQMSDIIRSKHGFHIIKLIASDQERTVPLEEARERIRELLLMQRAEVAVDEFTQPMLNDESRVSIFMRLEETLRNLESGGTASAAPAAAPAQPAAAATPPSDEGKKQGKKEKKKDKKN